MLGADALKMILMPLLSNDIDATVVYRRYSSQWNIILVLSFHYNL